MPDIRLLLFCTTSSPIGGVETWLDRICAYLPQRGFDPIVGLVRGQKHNDPDRFREFHPNLETIEVDGRGLNREGRVDVAYRAIRRLKPAIAMPLGVFDANEAILRTKSGPRGPHFIGRAQGNLPPMLADLEALREGLDQVVCPGALTARYLVERAGFAADRVRHIPNGSDPPVKPRTVRSVGYPIRLGYVGRMTRGDKRATDLPELCRQLNSRDVDFRLTVVGDGPSRNEIANGLAEFGSRVELRPPATHAELYEEVYPSLDCLVLLSSSEAFGIVLAEALMNGVVPVTSRYVGYHSEQLVVDREHGLSFSVGDMAAAADCIAELADDRDLFDRLSNAAQAHGENYSWDRCLASWERCLDDVLQRPLLQRQHISNGTRKSGRLDRLPIPSGFKNRMRRWRRSLFGSPIPSGGEEWPLFQRNYTADRLQGIEDALAELESATMVV